MPPSSCGSAASLTSWHSPPTKSISRVSGIGPPRWRTRVCSRYSKLSRFELRVARLDDFTHRGIYRRQDAESAGAVRESGISTHPWGRLALGADPFGHGCCFIKFSELGYDAIAT